MKVRREILIIFSMILLLVLPATSLGKEIKWVLERPVIPVLVKKPASPVIKGTLIMSLIHISEHTRHSQISYAVFC